MASRPTSGAQTEFFDDRAHLRRDFSWRDTTMPRNRLNYRHLVGPPHRQGRAAVQRCSRGIVDISWALAVHDATESPLPGGPPVPQSLGRQPQSAARRGDARQVVRHSVFSRVLDTNKERSAHKPLQLSRRRGAEPMQTDATMSRSFRLTERFNWGARVESYNISIASIGIIRRC